MRGSEKSGALNMADTVWNGLQIPGLGATKRRSGNSKGIKQITNATRHFSSTRLSQFLRKNDPTEDPINLKSGQSFF